MIGDAGVILLARNRSHAIDCGPCGDSETEVCMMYLRERGSDA